jgi:hypothetical protein
MSTRFHAASRTLAILALSLSAAACLAEDGDDGAAERTAEIADEFWAPLPVPVVRAPCVPGLPPSFPGCYPWRGPGGPPPPVSCGGPSCGP